MKKLGIKKWIRQGVMPLILAGGFLFHSTDVKAGPVEISGSFSFSQNTYGKNNYQWTRRWGASLGYAFWSLSQVEVSVQDVVYRTMFEASEDTTFHDQIYSLDWVQAFTSKNSGVQPYIKAGIGQLNRDATGTYAGNVPPPAVYDSITGVLGLGVKVYIGRVLALRLEAQSYLTRGAISTWQDNISLNGGMSLTF